MCNCVIVTMKVKDSVTFVIYLRRLFILAFKKVPREPIRFSIVEVGDGSNVIEIDFVGKITYD
jgi:hypothetical protein